MNSEKVKVIKENLEEEISFSKEYDLEFRRIPSDTLQDILTLINELESENEHLQNTCMNLNGKLMNMVRATAPTEWKLQQFAEKVIEKLKDNVNADNCDNYLECARFINDVFNEFTEAKSEKS